MLFVRMVKPNDIFLLFISELSSAQLRIDGCESESEWVRACHDVSIHLCHFHTFSLSLSFCFPFHENYANVENKLSPKTKLTHGVGHAVSHWLQNEKWWNSNFGISRVSRSHLVSVFRRYPWSTCQDLLNCTYRIKCRLMDWLAREHQTANSNDNEWRNTIRMRCVWCFMRARLSVAHNE